MPFWLNDDSFKLISKMFEHLVLYLHQLKKKNTLNALFIIKKMQHTECMNGLNKQGMVQRA